MNFMMHLHNLVVPNDIEGNPVLYVGDVQSRATMSWMQNEINREHQPTPYRESEMTTPFFMRLEVQYSRLTYLDWVSILGNPTRLGKVSVVREKDFTN